MRGGLRDGSCRVNGCWGEGSWCLGCHFGGLLGDWFFEVVVCMYVCTSAALVEVLESLLTAQLYECMEKCMDLFPMRIKKKETIIRSELEGYYLSNLCIYQVR